MLMNFPGRSREPKTVKNHTQKFSLCRRAHSHVAHSREHLKFNSTKETLYVMRFESLNKSMLHEKICRNVFWSEKCFLIAVRGVRRKGLRCWVWKWESSARIFYHSSTWDRTKAAINVCNRDCKRKFNIWSGILLDLRWNFRRCEFWEVKVLVRERLNSFQINLILGKQKAWNFAALQIAIRQIRLRVFREIARITSDLCMEWLTFLLKRCHVRWFTCSLMSFECNEDEKLLKLCLRAFVKLWKLFNGKFQRNQEPTIWMTKLRNSFRRITKTRSLVNPWNFYNIISRNPWKLCSTSATPCVLGKHPPNIEM